MGVFIWLLGPVSLGPLKYLVAHISLIWKEGHRKLILSGS